MEPEPEPESQSPGDGSGDGNSSSPKPQRRARRTGARRRNSVSSESRSANFAQELAVTEHAKDEADMQSIRDVVKDNFLFAHLDAATLDKVALAMFKVEFREGDVAITQGADGDNFYVVVSGKCNCYVGSRDETGLVAECGPGDSYGELALMYNAPRAASVVAATDSTLWALDRSSFTALLMKSAIDKRKAHMDFLEYTPLLSILSSYDRMTLADSLSSRNYEAGAKIIEQGAAADGMFVVWEGDVVVSRRLGDVGGEPAEEEEVLSKLKRGDYFGELALVRDQPRAATVLAASDAVCMFIPRQAFDKVFAALEPVLVEGIKAYGLPASRV